MSRSVPARAEGSPARGSQGLKVEAGGWGEAQTSREHSGPAECVRPPPLLSGTRKAHVGNRPWALLREGQDTQTKRSWRAQA